MTILQIGLLFLFAGLDLIVLAALLGQLHRLFFPGVEGRPAWLILAAGVGTIAAVAGALLSTGWLEAMAIKSCG